MIRITGRNDATYRMPIRTGRRFAETSSKMRTILLLSAMLLMNTLTAQNTTTLVIHGDSNVHKWEMDATEVNVRGMFKAEAGVLKSVDQLSVTVPAKKLKSRKKEKVMDEKTYDALKADKNPNITFTASKVTIAGQDITATGNLTIAGVTKPATIKAKWAKGTAGDIRIEGAYAFKLKDFSIPPPTALLGAIKVYEDITVKFTVNAKA